MARGPSIFVAYLGLIYVGSRAAGLHWVLVVPPVFDNSSYYDFAVLLHGQLQVPGPVPLELLCWEAYCLPGLLLV